MQTPAHPNHITMIGCGNMGRALLNGWLRDLPQTKFTIITPNSQPPAHDNVTHHREITKDIGQSDIVILAVKPQAIPEICAQIKPLIAPDQLIISIAAGKKTQSITDMLHPAQPVARIMPNTPVAIGKGMSIAVRNAQCTTLHAGWCDALMSACGEKAWIKDEGLMDVVTALSGSGPAYLFYFIEALADAGQSAGLSADLARQLARQMVVGAAALAESESDTPVETLRENVTSKGGTTAAGLGVLMDGKLSEIIKNTIQAATKRGSELNS